MTPGPPDEAPLHVRRNSRFVLLLLALLLPPGVVVLYRFEPGEGTFYPPCPFYYLTGLYCAGCGTTRCLHALLHGDLAQAFASNVFAVLGVPYLVYWFVRECLTAFLDVPPPRRRLPDWAMRAIVGLVFLFWVLRNLTFPPFTALAPHRLEGRGNQRGSTMKVGTVEPPPAVTFRSGSVAMRVRQPSTY